jgi:hypothetical protein
MQLFLSSGVMSFRGKNSMRNTAANFIHLNLNRRPVLTAMMVYSVGFGVAALMAAVAVWRANSSCPESRSPEQPYVVQTDNRDPHAQSMV